MTNDVKQLLDILPKDLFEIVEDPDALLEIVLDLGRPVEFRYVDGSYISVEDYIVNNQNIRDILKKLGQFGLDNRAGIDGTLHRISRIQNRYEETIGLTCRVGKPFIGSVNILKDLLESGKSLLFLGAPAMGKSTRLRDSARYLSSEMHKRVVIVDTSNEIAGDGNIPHSAVGRSRRLQVPNSKSQHVVMIEAIENHTPQAIVIDEISTLQEAQAAKTIAQRGVQLIATAHGRELKDLLNNPPLLDLVGGINSVTLSDDMMKQRGLESKTIQERKTDPPFDVVIEIGGFDEIRVHEHLPSAIDVILQGGKSLPEVRRELPNKDILIVSKAKIVPLQRVMPKDREKETLYDDAKRSGFRVKRK